MKEVVFYYDVVCPFAYMASRLIEGVARRNGAKILWKPVLLGKCQLSLHVNTAKQFEDPNEIRLNSFDSM